MEQMLFSLSALCCLIAWSESSPLKKTIDCQLFDKHGRIPMETAQGLRCLSRRNDSLRLGECKAAVEYKWRKVGSHDGFRIMAVGEDKCVVWNDSDLVLAQCGKSTWRYHNRTLTNEAIHLIAGECSYDTVTAPSICKRYQRDGKTFILLHSEGSRSTYAEVDEKGRAMNATLQSNGDVLSWCHKWIGSTVIESADRIIKSKLPSSFRPQISTETIANASEAKSTGTPLTSAVEKSKLSTEVPPSTVQARTTRSPIGSNPLISNLPIKFLIQNSEPRRPNLPSMTIIKRVIGSNPEEKIVGSTAGTDVPSKPSPAVTSITFAQRSDNLPNGGVQLTDFQLLTLVFVAIFAYF